MSLGKRKGKKELNSSKTLLVPKELLEKSLEMWPEANGRATAVGASRLVS
jgi:hypothetical protein